jgi:hypothetical protein
MNSRNPSHEGSAAQPFDADWRKIHPEEIAPAEAANVAAEAKAEELAKMKSSPTPFDA